MKPVAAVIVGLLALLYNTPMIPLAEMDKYVRNNSLQTAPDLSAIDLQITDMYDKTPAE